MPHAERQRGVPTPRSAPVPGAPAARDRIVVAVDGSSASVQALVWALQRAGELGLRVEALTVWPLHGAVFVREVAGHFCEPRWRAREVQAEAVSRALAAVDTAPPYDLRVVNADLVDALVRASTHAVLVVVGSDRPATHRDRRAGVPERLREAIADRLVVVGPDGPEEQPAAVASGPTAVRRPPRR